MYEIKGKTAVITGSRGGIGREIAIALAKEGARVVVNVKKRVDDGKSLRGVKEYSDGIMVQADVLTRQECRDLVKKPWTHMTRFISWSTNQKDVLK